MEQMEEEVVEMVAGSLKRLAHGLSNGEDIDRIDMSKALFRWAENLFDVLEGEAAGTDGTGGTDGTRLRQSCGGQADGARLRQGSRLRQGCGGRDGGQADAAEKQKGLIGIKSNEQHILAWNYSDGLDIRVTADEARENIWQVRLESDGKLRMMASIFGGRWMVAALVRGLRNAMTARRCKHRRTHANRRARKAANQEAK